jgi:hypothetical protein
MSEMTYMSIIQSCQVFTYEYVTESGWRWASMWSIPRRRPGKSTRACGVERVSNVSSREPNTYGLVWDDYLQALSSQAVSTIWLSLRLCSMTRRGGAGPRLVAGGRGPASWIWLRGSRPTARSAAGESSASLGRCHKHLVVPRMYRIECYRAKDKARQASDLHKRGALLVSDGTCPDGTDIADFWLPPDGRQWAVVTHSERQGRAHPGGLGARKRGLRVCPRRD